QAQTLGVRIFNISEHFTRGYEPPGLIDMIKPDNKESQSLFIVAAGNDRHEVCSTSFRVYPTCWSDEKNVLVVAASNDTDDDVRDDSNYSQTAVHLSAPGAGYYAAGEGRKYVPVMGTSFSTPLVTSAATLLYYGSSGLTEPWQIKQRLIATADLLPDKASS